MSEFDVGHVVTTQETEEKVRQAVPVNGFILITDTGFFARGMRFQRGWKLEWEMQIGGWEDPDVKARAGAASQDELEAGIWGWLLWYGEAAAKKRHVDGIVFPNAFILTNSNGAMVLARVVDVDRWRLYECSGADFGKIEALMHGRWSTVDSAREALHSALRIAKVTV